MIMTRLVSLLMVNFISYFILFSADSKFYLIFYLNIVYIILCYVLSDILSDEIKAAQEWFKRNREPFEDVAKNWNICQEVRLKTLIANPNITTEQYINQWLNILQQPQAYKLVYFCKSVV